MKHKIENLNWLQGEREKEILKHFEFIKERG